MTIQNVICDIDGVLMHDNVPCRALPSLSNAFSTKNASGDADQLPFPDRSGSGKPLCDGGIDVPDSVFYTSAMATADFLRRQEGKKPTWWVKAR
jgi:NagD protein